jgi:hypothetical protein
MTTQTTRTNRNEVDMMSKTSRSFMGGADYIDPEADLDKEMEKILATKNRGFRKKLEAQ